MATTGITKEYLYALYDKCNKYGHYYHDLDNPLVPDEVYDQCMQEVKTIEASHPEWIREDSPLSHVSGKASKNKLKKVKHPEQMQSLEDKFNYQDVEKWFLSLPTEARESNLFGVEVKIDGLSVCLEYRDGYFVQGSTRGDGWEGEDVTANLRYVEGVPLILSQNINGQNKGTIRIRAEVVMLNKEFIRINSEREQAGEDAYANPRNAAAGILRNTDLNAVRNSKLVAIAFCVMFSDLSCSFDGFCFGRTQIEDLKALKALGFITVPSYECHNLSDIESAIQTIGVDRHHLPYWADGAVVKVCNIAIQKQIGTTTKYPKWAVAYKYKTEEKTTHVVNIITQTGRTGIITPKVEFKPIDLGGTTVRFATLHNQSYIDALGGIAIGDEITVNKAAEIIPQVLEINTDIRRSGQKLFRIQTCPVCGGSATFVKKNEIALAYCMNINCPAQKARFFEYAASRAILNIDGLGPAIIDALVKNGMLDDKVDLFRLSQYRNEMERLPGVGEKTVKKILHGIEAAKKIPLYRIIAFLGIQGCGPAIGKILEAHYPSLESISIATEEELKKIDGIGPSLASAIYSFFKAPKNEKIITDLISCGVNTKANTNQGKSSTGRLMQKTFSITGKLQHFSRQGAIAIIEENGGIFSASVTKKTDYLLLGEDAGSKQKKAESLGITIITETQLLNMLS